MTFSTRLTLSLAYWCISLFGQAFTGTITGTVTDPNGAAIPGAAVRARNEATDDTRQQASNPEGLYIFSQLPPEAMKLRSKCRASVRPCRAARNSA